MRSFAKIFVRLDSVKSPTGYWTGHFCGTLPDTGPNLISGTPQTLIDN